MPRPRKKAGSTAGEGCPFVRAGGLAIIAAAVMDPSQWIAAFRITHEHARRGTLPEGEQRKYLVMRDELARSLMSSQGLTAPAGVSPRRAFKIAHVFPIELAGLYRSTTREISCSSFTTIVAATLKQGERISFSLNLSRAGDALTGFAIVKVAMRQTINSVRLTCDFDGLGEERLARLELALFDAALSRFGG